jgi:hypothetical protein
MQAWQFRGDRAAASRYCCCPRCLRGWRGREGGILAGRFPLGCSCCSRLAAWRDAAGGLSAGNQRDDKRTDRVGAAGRISRQLGPRLCQGAEGWTAAPIGVGFAHQFIS